MIKLRRMSNVLYAVILGQSSRLGILSKCQCDKTLQSCLIVVLWCNGLTSGLVAESSNHERLYY